MDDLRERLIMALEEPIGYGGTNSEDSYEKYDEMRLQAASAMRQMQAELRAIRTAAFNEARARIRAIVEGYASDEDLRRIEKMELEG